MKYPRIEFFQHEKTGQWYWRLRAKNGRIVADGAESYTRQRDVERAVGDDAPDQGLPRRAQ